MIELMPLQLSRHITHIRSSIRGG